MAKQKVQLVSITCSSNKNFKAEELLEILVKKVYKADFFVLMAKEGVSSELIENVFTLNNVIKSRHWMMGESALLRLQEINTKCIKSGNQPAFNITDISYIPMVPDDGVVHFVQYGDDLHIYVEAGGRIVKHVTRYLRFKSDYDTFEAVTSDEIEELINKLRSDQAFELTVFLKSVKNYTFNSCNDRRIWGSFAVVAAANPTVADMIDEQLNNIGDDDDDDDDDE